MVLTAAPLKNYIFSAPRRQGGQQGIDYRLEGDWDALTVDTEGAVSLVGPLDREAPGGAVREVLVVAVDRGTPPLSATATLTITVEDVNDCPPTLLPPTVLHVTEGGPPTLLSILKATDPDVWALGHGPPFTFSLAPSNPAHVLSLISLKFDPRTYFVQEVLCFVSPPWTSFLNFLLSLPLVQFFLPSVQSPVSFPRSFPSSRITHAFPVPLYL